MEEKIDKILKEIDKLWRAIDEIWESKRKDREDIEEGIWRVDVKVQGCETSIIKLTQTIKTNQEDTQEELDDIKERLERLEDICEGGEYI